jgi:hypothetical protein
MKERTLINKMYSTLLKLNLHTVVHADEKTSVYHRLNESKNISLSSTRFDLIYIVNKLHTARLVFHPWRVHCTHAFLLTLHMTGGIFELWLRDWARLMKYRFNHGLIFLSPAHTLPSPDSTQTEAESSQLVWSPYDKGEPNESIFAQKQCRPLQASYALPSFLQETFKF